MTSAPLGAPTQLQVELERSPGTGPRLGAMASKQVLLLAADLFEDMELLYPLYRLKEEGIGVTVAGLDRSPVAGRRATGRSRSTPPSIR